MLVAVRYWVTDTSITLAGWRPTDQAVATALEPVRGGRLLTRLTDLVLRHRVLVVLLWVVLAGTGAANAGRTVDALTYDFGLPGQPAYEANTAIQETYGGGGLDDPLVLTAEAPTGAGFSSDDGLAAFDRAALEVARAAPGTRLVLAGADPDVLVSDDGRRAVAVLYPRVVPGPDPYAAALPRIEQAVARTDVLGSPVALTGVPLLVEGQGGDRGVLVEVVLGGAGALLVLVLVFGSLLAGVPLLVAAVSILSTFLALLGLTAADRRLLRRAVPRGAHRARRGDRLLAADRHALARGALPGRRQRGRRSARRCAPPDGRCCSAG